MEELDEGPPPERLKKKELVHILIKFSHEMFGMEYYSGEEDDD